MPRSWAQRYATNSFTRIILATGALLLLWSVVNWESTDLRKFLAYVSLACLASGIKLSVPGVNTAMSSSFLFVLIGVVELSRPETILLAMAARLVEAYWQNPERPAANQVAFQVASMGLAAAVTHDCCLRDWDGRSMDMPVILMLAAVVFFFASTLQLAIASVLWEGKPVWEVWRSAYFWSFPAYLVGAAAAALLDIISKYIGWETSLLLLPVLYLVYNTQKVHYDKLCEAKIVADRERLHSLETAAIHVRTIETLALAIEAKDGTTRDHLERVQVYAVEVGRELGLSSDQLEALRAAAILHDIGKLAVPEYIISKPGKLTPAEFEKMKIHPVVGAQILDQVQFPYPVAPIVRSHHERWDGAGYPDGLRGEEIPLGARILAAVDCLDALASDRQYRRALPLKEAMAMVANDSGKQFDPRVVAVLQQRFVELEQKARRYSGSEERPKLLTDLRIERGVAPAAGYAEEEAASADLERLSESIEGSEKFGALAQNLQVAIGFDAFALFVERDEHMVPVYTHGAFARHVRQLRVPVGQGLVGWVAKNHKPMINGNPAVEPGYVSGADGGVLKSALAVPLSLELPSPPVICLYRSKRDGFHREHLRLLQILSAESGMPGCDMAPLSPPRLSRAIEV